MPEWVATLICPDDDFDGAPLLRCEFTLDNGHGPVIGATLHATAHGVFEAYLNGQRVSDDVLSSRLEQLRMAAALPELRRHGTCCDRRPYSASPSATGGSAAGWAGPAAGPITAMSWAPSRSWRSSSATATFRPWSPTSPGPRAPRPSWPTTSTTGKRSTLGSCSDDWLLPGFSDPSWTGVHSGELDLATLTPYVGPPVRRQEELAPVRIWTSPSGRTLVDFGQNLVGWISVRVQGAAGTVVTLRHAEVLEHDELGVRPAAYGQGHGPVHPQRWGGRVRANLHLPRLPLCRGRRLARASSTPDALTAVVVSSELRRIGTFECSDELLNQLHRNVVWGTRGNFLDVPTDCPQRDERLGWTGDLAAFAPSAAYLFDVDALPPRLVAGSGGRTDGRRRDGAVRGARCPQVHRAPLPLPSAR